MLTVSDLRCEFVHQPIAVEGVHPRFSWKLESDRDNVTQSDYHLQVARDAAFTDPIWDSGTVASSESHLATYDGPPLEPRTRYFYRVRVGSGGGDRSEFSEPSWFETALPAGRWRHRFIGAEERAEESPSRPTYLRREFAIDGEVKTARIYATALGLYELRINGQRVGEAYFTPGWTNYRKRLAYQTYDVTSLVTRGENALGAIVASGWYAGDLTWLGARNLFGERTGLSLELVVEKTDGKWIRMSSDEEFRVGVGGITYSELYHGEHYDGRLEPRDWSRAGFDDSAWSPAVPVEFDARRITPQDGPFVEKRERLPALRLIETPRGEKVLDFGQNLTGWVALSVEGKPGDRVVLRHAEILDAEGNFYTENLRTARAQDEYTLEDHGRRELEPHFTFHGFRYVEVVEYPGEIDPASFTAVVLHSAMEESLTFECSHPLLNRLHHNILWGWKGNALDVPTDCPQRDERLGWTGDAEVFIGTASYQTDVSLFYRKWLRDLTSEQRSDGGVPFVVPDVLEGLMSGDSMITASHSSTGWGDAAVICPWTVYQRYGDLRLLREQYPSMKAWVEYIRARAEGGLIWNSGFHFGDWVALDAKEGSYFGATPNDLTATAFYAYSTLLLARAGEALGESDEARGYHELHRRIVDAFRAEFVTPAGRIAAPTQTAHVLALVFDLVQESDRPRVLRDLVALLEANDGHLTTGFLGTPFLCRALAENGRLDAAYELLLREDYPSWLYQVTMGATTVWEHWDGIKPDGSMWSAAMNSFNHYAYGAIGEWIYATIGGIAPAAPGFRSVRLSPRPGGGITWAKTSYASPYGKITLAWRIEDARLSLEAEVPPNSSATIVLEGVAADEIDCGGLLEFRDEGGAATAEVGSGSYKLACPWRQATPAR